MATIQGVYVALFGRPADPTGLAYFNGVTQNGANLNGIGDLASTQEYKDRFAGQNNTQIVNSIYQSLFGRDAEAAGLNFFVDALNKGTLNVKNIAIAILDGAQGNDKTVSANKVAAADLYTKALDTPTEVGSYSGNAAAAQGRAFVAGVTTTVPTAAAVDTAVAAMVAVGAAGNTITAGGAIATLSTTQGITDSVSNTTKTTTNNNDTINAGANFAPTTSKIDGGLGIDTLNATVDGLAAGGTGTIATGALTSVENVFLKAAAAAGVVEFQNTTGIAQVWNDASGAALTANGVAQTTTLGLKGTIGAATTFAFADTAGTNTANVAFDGAAAAGQAVTVAGTEVFNISNTGTSVVDTLTVASAQTINVSGSGTLTLGVAASAAVLDTVNASSFTGSLTFNGSSNEALKTVNGGTGSDKITIDTVHANDITINAGAGTDTITVNATGTATKALVLTGGEGADQFVFQNLGNVVNNTAATPAVDAASLAKTLVTITDFNASADALKLSFGLAGGATGSRDVILGAEQSDINTKTSLLDAVKTAASYTDLGKFSIFSYAGDSYVFVNNSDAGAATTLDAGDSLIKVTGISDVSSFTASNLQIS